MDGRERLRRAIDDRAVDLRIRLKEVARRAGMSDANLFRIRTGTIAVTPLAAAGLEYALDWEAGSVAAVLSGGEPTLRQPREIPASPPPGYGISEQEWASWDADSRQVVLSAIELARARMRHAEVTRLGEARSVPAE